MSKIPLIIKREYLTRVKKKTFLVMTLLMPVLMVGIMLIPAWLMSMKDDKEKKLAVIDYTGLYNDKIQSTDILKFDFMSKDKEAELRSNFKALDYYAFLIIDGDLQINPNAIKLYSDAQITVDVKSHVTNSLKQYLKDEKLKSFEIEGLDEAMTEINKIDVNVSTVKISDDGTEKQSSSEFAMIISMVLALVLFFVVMMYGSQVFTGVMEEKTSRIVEVLISSVKPFELMMGKIVGIALVALTQFFLWIILTVAITSVAGALLSSNTDISALTSQLDANSVQQIEEMASSPGFQFDNIMEIVNSFNPVKTLLLFFFFFIGGYLLYASLYAAVGSAVDNETDAQQFMMPITIPIMIAFYIAYMTFNNPSSSIVFWGSMIPFSSPIVMMARIPYGVPVWEIALSMALLVAGFIFTTWFAARIYRTGILMYGKKVDYKELWKWFKYSNR